VENTRPLPNDAEPALSLRRRLVNSLIGGTAGSVIACILQLVLFPPTDLLFLGIIAGFLAGCFGGAIVEGKTAGAIIMGVVGAVVIGPLFLYLLFVGVLLLAFGRLGL
jgi:hypothetical protein